MWERQSDPFRIIRIWHFGYTQFLHRSISTFVNDKTTWEHFASRCSKYSISAFKHRQARDSLLCVAPDWDPHDGIGKHDSAHLHLIYCPGVLRCCSAHKIPEHPRNAKLVITNHKGRNHNYTHTGNLDLMMIHHRVVIWRCDLRSLRAKSMFGIHDRGTSFTSWALPFHLKTHS